MNLQVGSSCSVIDSNLFSALAHILSRILMARKGGKSKLPAGCSGPYRPYSTASKLEQLRRSHEHGHRSPGENEGTVDNEARDASGKGMELRSRAVRQSPREQKKTSQKFKLDDMEALTTSPEQVRQSSIQRSSSAGNGRRVSAAPRRDTRNESRGEARSSQGRPSPRNDGQREERDVEMEDDMDMVAPLTRHSSERGSDGAGSPLSTPLGKQAFKSSLHVDSSDAVRQRKRMKFFHPQADPGEPVNPNNSTPQSHSRLSLGIPNGATRNRRDDSMPELQHSDSVHMEKTNEEHPSEAPQGRANTIRSVPPNVQSGVTHVDLQTRMERLLTSLRADILKEIRESQRAQSTQLRRVELQFSESTQSIRSQLQDLSDLVQNRSSGQSSTTSGAQCKTPLAEWEQKLEEMTPFKKEVFSSSVFARVLGYNLPLCVTKICAEQPAKNVSTEHPRNIVDMASESLATLLFSLKPNESRDKNAEGIGKRHSEFKFSVIQNTFYNVQKNTFQQFKVSGARDEDDNTSTAHRLGLLTQPLWLKPGFVSPTTILAARSFLENKQQAKRDKVKDAPSRNDIAMHGAVKAYRYLTSHLHDGREKVKSMFFQDLGYLLVDWASLISDVDQAELSLSWEEEALEQVHVEDVYFNLGTVPETRVARGGGTINDADSTNRDLISDLYKKSKEMVLIAEHEVFVLTGDSSRNKQRKHSGGQRRPIRRLIHMIEVAANFCKEFTQLPDVWAFLRSHTESLRCIYALAIVFREMTLNFLSKADIQDGRIPSPNDVGVSPTRLIHLLPGKGSRASLMASRCLRMVESEYETLNQPDITTERRAPHAVPEYSADVGAEILASASLGVAAL